MFGLLLGTIGMDSISGTQRLTFGILELTDGIGFIPAVMGLFGVSEILVNVERTVATTLVTDNGQKPPADPEDWKESIWPIAGGRFSVFSSGCFRARAGHLHVQFLRAGEEDFQDPETFGTGHIVGVAGPESANNAASSGAMIPLFTLGIPANSVIAVLLGAFMIHGLQPGPMFISRASGRLLGHDREHVPRQCHASGIEPAPDPALGQGA